MNTTTLQRPLLAWALGLSLAALATPGYATHSWNGYHWASTTRPITLWLGNNMTGDWNALLSQTSAAWNAGDSNAVFRNEVVMGGGGKRCSTVTGTTQVCNGSYGNNGWLGLATIYLSGTHITKGIAKMNDTYFSTDYYNNPNEKLHVVCQEVAHTFGLDHQSEDGSSQNSCMDYFSNTGANADSTVSTAPNQHDFDVLSDIYGHVDFTTTVATSAPPTGPGRNKSVEDLSEDPKSWGQLISQTAKGRSSVYERRNPDGSTILTHVYWTVEAASACPSCDHRYERQPSPAR